MTPWLGLVLAAALAQSAWLARLDILGSHLNLVLALVVCWSLLRGGRAGLIWGLAGGIALDLLSSAPFGTFAIALLVTAFVVGLVEMTPLRPSLPLAVGALALASLLFHLAALVTMQSLGWDVAWGRAWRGLLPAAALDAALALACFPPLRRLSQHMGAREIEWS